MATRFRFRLEGLLKLRKALEDDARRNLARVIQARDAIEARIRHLEQEQERMVESRRVGQGQAVNLEFLRAAERYQVALEHRVAHARQDLAEALRRIEEARQALAKAHQAYLMLLRLKERRQEQHTQEALLEEFRDIDELAVLRYRFNTTRPPAAMAQEVSP